MADDLPYRPVESIEFIYDSAGEFYCALTVTDKSNFALNPPHPMSLQSKRALRLKAEQLWDTSVVMKTEGSGCGYF